MVASHERWMKRLPWDLRWPVARRESGGRSELAGRDDGFAIYVRDRRAGLESFPHFQKAGFQFSHSASVIHERAV